ncbi:AlbA family DNA-binding domain-containing protein [Pseudonocardia nigra]|uniref:AlbA family DNA-binding domain-containing protein n=1 Tax=Pseudonocardia nigra TaxID=1921578 RepID=UPI001C5F0163|nr:ATP-binding protein [Pseudonocardia nigra]
MTERQRLEARVHEILDAPGAEDSFVDFKRQLPDDYRRAARQIAALANAARGDEAVWLIGVENDGHLTSATPSFETQSWWPQVESWFDELAPSVTQLLVPRPGGTVLALFFETDRAPYVVKTGGQSPEREVP